MDTNNLTKNYVHIVLEVINSNVPINGLKGYLVDLFSDLLIRTGNENAMLGLSFFQDFLQLPLFISERIFTICNKNQNGYLKKRDFVEGLCALYAGTIDQQIKTAFQILDFNDDGCIEYDDVLLVLSHFHFLKLTDSSIEELVNLVKKSFNGINQLTYDAYLEHIVTISSDFILLFLFFISHYRPYSDENIRYYSDIFISSNSPFACASMSPTRSRRESKKSLFSNSTTPEGTITERRSNPLITPTDLLDDNITAQYSMKFFPPSRDLLKYLIDYYDIQIIDEDTVNEICLLKTGQLMKLIDHHTDFDEIEELQLADTNTDNNQIEKKVPFKKDFGPSDDNNQQHDQNNKIHSIDFTSNEKEINTSHSSQSNFSTYSYSTFTTSQNTCKQEIILFRINKKGKLKRQKLVLFNDTLFFFKNQNCTDSFAFKGIISLRSTYVEKCYEVEVESKKYYPFQLTSNIGFKNFQTNFLCQTEDDMIHFVSAIRKAKKFERIQDCYDMKEEIGHGQFGKIHLGVSKLTQEKVAIKILRKKEFKEKHFQMVKSEIDIFKFLKNTNNPYLIKAKDYYETQNTIYMIYEYIPNGNLNEFLFNKKEIMSSLELKTIIWQIVEGIKYLHRYGIMHRDLKPDNILVSKVKGKFNHVKIIDFGLSKISGKQQRTSESFGSLCFSGPEIFLNKPYDHRIDIWSLGVTVYYLKYAALPFDDSSNEPKVIVKKIISNEVKFPSISDSDSQSFELELQALMKQCLIKNFEKRIYINEISIR